MEQFLSQLLGTTNVPTYMAGFVLALVGALLSLRLHARSRDKYGDATPVRFSFRFMLLDNLSRLFTGFLISFVAFRFTNELLGVGFTMWAAFLIGFLNDRVAGLIGKIELKAREK